MLSVEADDGQRVRHITNNTKPKGINVNERMWMNCVLVMKAIALPINYAMLLVYMLYIYMGKVIKGNRVFVVVVVVVVFWLNSVLFVCSETGFFFRPACCILADVVFAICRRSGCVRNRWKINPVKYDTENGLGELFVMKRVSSGV